MNKTGTLGLIVCALVVVSVANLAAADPWKQQESAVVQSVVVQDLAPAEAPPVPADVAPPETVLLSPVIDQELRYLPTVGCPTCDCCDCCECADPVPTMFCLVEPTCGCSYEVCIKVPACCVGQAPVIKWRDGILGRKIAKLCWPCCKKRVRVVVPVFGDVRVWD